MPHVFPLWLVAHASCFPVVAGSPCLHRIALVNRHYAHDPPAALLMFSTPPTCFLMVRFSQPSALTQTSTSDFKDCANNPGKTAYRCTFYTSHPKVNMHAQWLIYASSSVLTYGKGSAITSSVSFSAPVPLPNRTYLRAVPLPSTGHRGPCPSCPMASTLEA